MTFFCVQCWNKIDEAASVCPSCGADQNALRKETFVQKLIRALRHPDLVRHMREALESHPQTENPS